MQPIAFLPSTDLDRSQRFFVDVVGLTLRESTPFACVLATGSPEVMLRVTLVDSLRPQAFTVLGWQVDDIAAEMGRLAAAGVAFAHYEGLGQDDHEVWRTPEGDQIAWFHDPDGNVLSLTQFA
jgi:catechol 2,3-dioxygenase-like lactoylglutathione lyase family enzyme